MYSNINDSNLAFGVSLGIGESQRKISFTPKGSSGQVFLAF